MTTRIRLWTNISTSMLIIGGASLAVAQAGEIPAAHGGSFQLAANADGGEGGEGGEGGASLSTYSLSSADPNAFAYDASAEIAAYVTHVKSSYEAAAAGAYDLQVAVDAFLAAPSEENLATARTAWIKARPAYLKTETFRFYDGPIEEVEGLINSWPLNEAFIDYVKDDPKAGIVNDPKKPLTLEAITAANQVTDEADVTTGWHAIEFLLWGQDLSETGPGARPATDYTPGTEANDRRRTYLKLVTDLLVTDLEGLIAAWDASKPGTYAARFLQLPQREALGRALNGMAVLAGFEFMSERLAVALDSGDQEDEHSCFSDTTKQDLVYDLEGMSQAWFGTNPQGPSFAKLLASRDAKLAQEVKDLFADAKAKIAALGDPWDRVLAAEKGTPPRDAAEAAVASLAALAEGLKKAGVKLGVIVQIPS